MSDRTALDADVPARLAPPRGVLEIARRLEKAGFETWCVGGAVRDALLDHPQLDWDLATAATPDEMRRLFRRTVPKGVEFGTLGIFDSDGEMHEVTTFRRDVRTDGRHAVVEFGASLDDDLARRDFTINAIAYSPERHVVHDPFGGRHDLVRGVVRAVGDPATRMREDRLRALRAIRFAGRFGFAIDDATWGAIVDSAPHLVRLSAERVREELEKTMKQVARPSLALERWRASGALGVLVPELADAQPERFATADCLPMPTLAARPQRLDLRLASLWLDAEPRAVDEALRRLRASNAKVRATTELADRWRRIGGAVRDALLADTPPRDADIRRWAAATGRTRLPMLLRLAAARFAAERLLGEVAPEPSSLRALYRRAVRIAYRDPVDVADLAVSGGDLLSIPGVRGPLVGELLRRLLERVVEDPRLNTRDALLAIARELLSELGG
ncbi:Polynucleotide adenylyltransferase region [Gemmatirosa kalamazoonensis]|uniref:Polynucleotide adenylyltransferase region n=1 Tax=Gemmatirosa kalamazoonensis TaxID=861299 RepID=W0RL45_9BACT|nr:CCA tRNA nucleotidyltransferase [Gemmatirosa kalamazoonensis]AHG91050.1 Polynucleotide adenylyltransferase region [Gemmatirosa kalamazoonensis]